MSNKTKGILDGRKCKAFTLIELLIVIVIIGILAGLVVFSVRSAIIKARDAQAKNAVREVKTAVETWLAENSGRSLVDEFGNGRVIDVKMGTFADSQGNSLLNHNPIDGQGKAVTLKVMSGNQYRIEGKTAGDLTKCWVASNSNAGDNLGGNAYQCQN